MKIETHFNYDKVAFDKENTVAGVVTLKAPKIDWQKKRASICVIASIDASGSMEGNKFEYAKLSALKLVDHLQPGDYFGLVVFGTDVYPVVKPVEITQTQKDIIKAKIGELRIVGSTNLAGGMLKALEWANEMDLPATVIRRVIMFTDGQPTHGPAVSAEDILTLLGKTLKNSTVSAFGYGHGANQDLLTAMARLGNGNYAFVEKPEDALSAFAKELGGLLSTYGQKIEIDLAAHNGHEITEIVSDVDVEEKETGKRVMVKLSDILSEEERHIVFKMKLSSQSQSLPRAMTAVDVKVTYQKLGDDAKSGEETLESKGKIEFVKPGKEQAKPNDRIDKIVATAELVKAQVEAEECAKRGDFKGAQVVLRNQSMDFESRGLDVFNNAAEQISTNYLSYANYERSGDVRNSVRSSVTRSGGSYSSSGNAADILKSLHTATGAVTSNNAQDMMTAAFTSTGSTMNPDVSKVIVSPSIPGVEKEPKKQSKKESSLSKNRSKRW